MGIFENVAFLASVLWEQVCMGYLIKYQLLQQLGPSNWVALSGSVSISPKVCLSRPPPQIYQFIHSQQWYIFNGLISVCDCMRSRSCLNPAFGAFKFTARLPDENYKSHLQENSYFSLSPKISCRLLWVDVTGFTVKPSNLKIQGWDE